MNKISPELLSRCDKAACCANEFVILPPDGDSGFEEYFLYKARRSRVKKHLVLREEQTRLILKYPSPMAGDAVFNRFFDSPAVVAANQEFEGCFGIDLTEYLNRTSDPRLDQLIQFIRRHPAVTYVLFVYTQDLRKGTSLLGALDRYFPLQPLQIPLPDTDRLTEYLSDLVGGDGGFEKPVEEEIRAFFSSAASGYDTADFLARELRERGFNGEKQVLLDALAYMKDVTDHRERFGF